MIYVQQFSFVLCKFCPDWKSGIFATFSFVFIQSNWNKVLYRFCPNQSPGIWPSSKHLPMYSPEVPELSLILLSTNLELPDWDGFYEIRKRILKWFDYQWSPKPAQAQQQEGIHTPVQIFQSDSLTIRLYFLLSKYFPLQIFSCPYISEGWDAPHPGLALEDTPPQQKIQSTPKI